ncbi:MAG: AraC family transcriptional regulator [Pseudomonadota bacterium]
MSFNDFGPIDLNKDAVLNGWGAPLGEGMTAVYGALDVRASIKQLFTEPMPGLVMYAPSSGVTTVSATTYPGLLRIYPGQAYFYSAEAGSYFAEFTDPGAYSGLKVFFDADAIAQLETQAARSYCKHPQRMIFAETPIGKDALARIASLPPVRPTTLPGELGLLADLNGIVADVLSAWEATEAGGQGAESHSGDAQLEAADQYLKTHLAAPPAVLSLANLVGLNHMTMKRGFRRVYGTTVYGRLRYWRMRRAAELLGSGVSVTDTALEVGYSNPSKFSAAYRKETGRNPSDS